jgi:hypothetical protein
MILDGLIGLWRFDTPHGGNPSLASNTPLYTGSLEHAFCEDRMIPVGTGARLGQPLPIDLNYDLNPQYSIAPWAGYKANTSLNSEAYSVGFPITDFVLEPWSTGSFKTEDKEKYSFTGSFSIFVGAPLPSAACFGLPYNEPTGSTWNAYYDTLISQSIVGANDIVADSQLRYFCLLAHENYRLQLFGRQPYNNLQMEFSMRTQLPSFSAKVSLDVSASIASFASAQHRQQPWMHIVRYDATSKKLSYDIRNPLFPLQNYSSSAYITASVPGFNWYTSSLYLGTEMTEHAETPTSISNSFAMGTTIQGSIYPSSVDNLMIWDRSITDEERDFLIDNESNAALLNYGEMIYECEAEQLIVNSISEGVNLGDNLYKLSPRGELSIAGILIEDPLLGKEFEFMENGDLKVRVLKERYI